MPATRCNPLKTLEHTGPGAGRRRLHRGLGLAQRTEFLHGHDEIVAFLTRKWQHEQDYALRNSLWAFSGDRIAARFQYEWHDATGNWWRSYGNENWKFDAHGCMNRREASINDIATTTAERRLLGPRPSAEHDHTLPLQ